MAERVIEEKKYNRSSIRITEVDSLKGSTNSMTAERLFYLRNAGVTLKNVKVNINGDLLTTESGAFYYSKGNIRTNVSMGGFSGGMKRVLAGNVTQEAVIKPEYTGNGEVVLEPSFKHFKIVELKNTSLIVNKGIYYCSLGNISVGVAQTGGIMENTLGGDGMFQTRISGTGLVVLSIPVPHEEIVVYELNNESLRVDGNFFILRDASLKYKLTGSANTGLGSILSDEGFVADISGSGVVWLAPTAPVYSQLEWGSIKNIDGSNKNNSYNKGR